MPRHVVNVSPRVALIEAFVFVVLSMTGSGVGAQPPVTMVENVPVDEAVRIDNIVRLTLLQMKERYSGNARVLRGVHPKDHGCVTAKFKVLETVPAELRVGLFANPGSEYSAWIRFSNAAVLVKPDSDTRGHGSRGMAIKLMGVSGESLLKPNGALTQDFLLVNHPVFAFSNVEDYEALSQILLDDHDIPDRFFGDRIKKLPNGTPDFADAMTRRAVRSLMIVKRIQSTSMTAVPPAPRPFQAPPASPVDNQYFSGAPFLFGPNKVAKFSVKPIAPDVASVPDATEPNYLRKALAKRLGSQGAADVIFEFKVQVRPASDLAGKIDSEIEDACFEWDESVYPFVTVATLTIPPQDFNTPERLSQCEDLVFTPWHGLVDHRPIGGINRLRRAVYEASAGFRHLPKEPAQLPVPEKRTSLIPRAINAPESVDVDLLHYADQGSGFFPMDVVRALSDSKTGRPFLENLERFGLVPGEKSSRNPEGFPVGIVTNTVSVKLPTRTIDLKMFGFTCAACHTSDIKYEGKVVRIDGGSGLFNVDELGDQISASIQATLSNPKEVTAFLDRFSKQLALDPVRLASLRLLLSEIETDSEMGRGLADDIRGLMDNLKKEIHASTAADIQKVKALVESGDRSDHLPLVMIVTELLMQHHEGRGLLGNLQATAQRAALVATLADLEEVIGNLRYRLAFLKIRDWLAKPNNRLPAGHGRADDFGTARVELFASWSKFNLRPVNAPVSVPPLWNVDKFAWLHANANTNSVIQRSIGEAIGVGATFQQDGTTSVNIVNQMLIEEQIQKLTAPRWPEEFGKLDADRVSRGRIIYQRLCAECHDPREVDSNGLFNSPLSSLDEIGTYPNVAFNFDFPLTAQDGKTTTMSAAIAEVLNGLQKSAREQFTAQDPQNAARMAALEARHVPVKWRNTMTETGGSVYPAKPLDGIWATAPYLHNGSVPSLWALLTPADRPKTFPVGQKDYNPKFVGFELDRAKITSQPGLVLFELDTSIPGNSSSGHEGERFGTMLRPAEKLDLIEYLKTHTTTWPPTPQ
jgi:mono/diheme cytochrome c family protein